jgi:23S rRNA (adenine2503-C2)-methyltransferase
MTRSTKRHCSKRPAYLVVWNIRVFEFVSNFVLRISDQTNSYYGLCVCMTSAPSRPLFCDFSQQELVAWCEARGQAAYRAVQIRRWLFGKRVNDFAAMHDLPARLRAELADSFTLFSTKEVARQTARDGTEKLLLECFDGSKVECVLMREPRRQTICISTQVGCAMGCVFCASGLLGLKRNLSTGEILEQVLRLDRLLGPDERITNVVVMGIGEPLANLKALVPALETLNEKGGMGLGARRITISTVGLPEKIRELAELGKPFNLAVSLHAPNDMLRNELVPVNDKIGIDAILQAADEYFRHTGRRVTYEYVLIGGLNDTPMLARQLAALLVDRTAHVNLIPMNDVQELPFHEPTVPRTREFVEILERAGIPATVRKRKGADVDAACGQLRLQHEQRPVATG